MMHSGVINLEGGSKAALVYGQVMIKCIHMYMYICIYYVYIDIT